MSVDWAFRFRAEGPNELVEELAAGLDDLRWPEYDPDYWIFNWIKRVEPKSQMFCCTNIVKQKPGYLEARVERNYFGGEAIEQMAALFPGLAFHGSGCTQACETIHSFEARGGEVAWTSKDAELVEQQEEDGERLRGTEEWLEEEEERLSGLADNALNCGRTHITQDMLNELCAANGMDIDDEA